MRYAIVSDSTVRAVIVWDGTKPYTPPDGASLVAIPDGLPVDSGWIYEDPQGFTAPPPRPGTTQRIFGCYEFVERFLGMDVLIACQLSTDPAVIIARSNLQLRAFVDLDFPQTGELLQILEAAGILPPGRTAEILEGIELQ